MKLDDVEREMMISALEWRTAFNREYLIKLSDVELEKLYEERR